MKRRGLFLTLAVLACLSAAPVTAMAAEWVNEVYISLVPEDEIYNMKPGDVMAGMEPTVPDDDEYWISDFYYSNSDYEPGKSYTYTIEVQSENGYSFDTDTEVTVYGAYEVSVNVKSSRRMTIKARTYPIYVLPQVSGISIEDKSTKATWDKVPHAKSYEVYIYYTDNNGSERSVKRTTSTASISLSNYLSKNDLRYSVRALKGSSTADRFIAQSSAVFEDGSVDDQEEIEQYDFRIPTANRQGTREDDDSSSGSGSYNPYSGGPGGSSITPQPGGPAGGTYSTGTFNGWQGSGSEWYYLVGGMRATGWVQPKPDEWYLLDTNGLMLAGWRNVGGLTYYMNTNHDGTYGKMLSGLQTIDGHLFYFNEQHDGTFGALYVNRYIPDGRYAGANGIIN